MRNRWAGQHGLWFALPLLLSLLNSVLTQPGFLSIDCGAKTSNTDSLGIEWTTDAPYISTGINQILNRPATSDFNQEQLQTLRYFPANRSKHCYILPATKNTTYLIRASFLHGGFQPTVDNSFSLSIDSSSVDDLVWTDTYIDGVFAFEYVVATSENTDSISFCLIPKGTAAFINTLELRPLAVGMYDSVYNAKYLKLLTRLNCGAALSDPPVRYPDDSYDRIWYTPTFKITGTKTEEKVLVSDYIFDRPPSAVMQSAWVSSESFWWSYDLGEYELALTKTYYVNHFFAEIQNVKATDTRIVDIFFNGESYYPNLTVTSDAHEIFLKHLSVDSTGSLNFSFSANPKSTLGPILNAGEIYASRDKVISSTNDQDANVLEVLKTNMGLSSWAGDPCLPVAFDWLTCDKGFTPRVTSIKLSNYNLTGTIPQSIADMTALTDLWLDNNKIVGAIPDLSTLTKLKTLHLQNNRMSGGIPSTLASLPSLKELFLQNNQFSGPIPASLNRNGLDLQTSGNVKLCASTENCPILPVDLSGSNSTLGGGGRKSSGSGVVIGIAVGVAVAVIIVICLLVWCYCKRWKKPSTTTDTQSGAVQRNQTGSSTASSTAGPGALLGKQARSFTLHEVEVATHNYKTMIGQGGFGPVYYGRLADGTEVAVKVNSETSSQGTTEFLNEVSLLSRVHHKNLVSLLGYCEENQQQILVYEYMPNGTLREHLYGKDMKGRLNWRERVDIALNAAKGLEYLHNDCIPRIIHRDIKSNNILLSLKLLAKVADFGISRHTAEEDDTSGGVSTIVRGTTGYLDPEYYAHNRLTHKSDVYSFGVVLLEMICGRPPNNNNHSDPRQHNLVDWARSQLNSNDLSSIIDPYIKGMYNVESMWKVAELAMGCVEPSGANRPDMNQVVRALTVAAELEGHTERPTGVTGPASYQPTGDTATGDNPSTFNTDSSYPSTQESVTSSSNHLPSWGTRPDGPPPLFTPQGTFARLPSDTRNSGDNNSWLSPQPR
ncbi:hypothetical protein R1sor_002166 [Riccia sorocarpa]|uniref:non-specific serine/threonine protein kinase n=1 Tax=Riccia sorocarpa TaxID=122646 RepID=A0ABD3H201_9MARC